MGILLSGALFAQTDVIIPESNEAAADINNTTTAITENYTNQFDLFQNSKNELNMFNSSASVGTSVLMSKYVSVYNIPLSYSFKTKLIFKGAYENLSFKAIIPFINKKVDAGTAEIKTTGFGDISLKANYNLIMNNMFFSLGVLAKLPTAKKKNIVEGHDIPLGTGSTDLNVSIFFAKSVSDMINVHSSLGYDLRTEYEKEGVNYDYGNRFNLLVGADYLVKIANIGADFSFTSVQNSIATFAGFPFESPGITSIDAIPYAKIGLTETIDVKLFGVIPISSKWKSIPGGLAGIPDPDRKIRFGFTFVYKFEKKGE